MPAIENYSSRIITSANKTSASDFADTRGLEMASKALDKTSYDLEKLRDVRLQVRQYEDGIAEAKILSDGQQEWMLEMDRRRQAIEAGELSYQDYTDNFLTDFSNWSKQAVARLPNPNKAAEFEVKLTDMQNSFLSSTMTYEAAKRAEKIKVNYDSITAQSMLALGSARTPQDVEAAAGMASIAASALPDDLRQDMQNKIDITKVSSLVDLSEDYASLNAIEEQLKSGAVPSMTNEQGLMLGNQLNTKRKIIQTSNQTKVENQLKLLHNLAATGDLPEAQMVAARTNQTMDLAVDEVKPFAFDIAVKKTLTVDEIEKSIGGRASSEDDPLISSIRENYEPEQQEMLIAAYEDIKVKNAYAKAIFGMSNADYAEFVSPVVQSLQSEQDPQAKAQLNEKLTFIQTLRADRDKALASDFVGVATAKNPLVASAYSKYVQAAEEGSPDTAKLFQNYTDALDSYKKDIGYAQPIDYLSKDQVSILSQKVDMALQTENGLSQFVTEIENMQTLYGPKFKSVIKQLRKENENFSVLSMIPRVQLNGGNVRAAKNDIVAALKLRITNPDAYKKTRDGEDALPFLEGDALTKRAAMLAQSPDEVLDRDSTYTLLNEYYTATNEKDPMGRASQIAYGDMNITDGILHPVNKNITGIVNNAAIYMKDLVQSDKALMIDGATPLDIKNIKANPQEYITWETNENADGARAIWVETEQPVYSADGNPIEFSFDQNDLFQDSRRKIGMTKPKSPAGSDLLKAVGK